MRIGSLFSGIGGLDLACEWAWPGSRTVWQLDQVNAAVRRRHWPDALQVEADVTTVDPLALPAVDVLCGGFPCQDLSVAGKQAGLDGERSGLYREVLRFTAAIRSRFVVCENVSGLLPYMPRLAADFRALGYGLSYAVCEAADAGHPHLRQRVFILAERGSSGRGLVEVDRRGRWTGQGEREWPTATTNEGHRPSYRARGVEGDSLAGAIRVWPTPMAGSDAPNGHGGANRDLPDAVRPWPTPRADEARTSGGRTGRDGDGESLTYAARPWATPSASNPNEGEDPASWHTRAARLKEKGINGNGAAEPLGQQVRAWPTPVSRDYKTGELPDRVGSESLSAAGGAAELGTFGRRLNPAWVECLMGYPPGWTEPTGPRLECRRNAPAVRGRYPADWDRSVPWPGYAWEPSRTIPDGPAQPGRPARVKACGNAVCPQQGALALDALLADDGRQVKLW